MIHNHVLAVLCFVFPLKQFWNQCCNNSDDPDPKQNEWETQSHKEQDYTACSTDKTAT